jgi:hypothetical protein
MKVRKKQQKENFQENKLKEKYSSSFYSANYHLIHFE